MTLLEWIIEEFPICAKCEYAIQWMEHIGIACIDDAWNKCYRGDWMILLAKELEVDTSAINCPEHLLEYDSEYEYADDYSASGSNIAVLLKQIADECRELLTEQVMAAAKELGIS